MSSKVSRGKAFTKAELESLLEVIEEILPIEMNEWEAVLTRHLTRYPYSDRTKVSIKRKFSSLYNSKIPTGDPTCPSTVKTAKKIYKLIKEKIEISGHTKESSKRKFASLYDSETPTGDPTRVTCAEQLILNDDKKTQYAQFARKPHADASRRYNLTAPPFSYKGENWKYFHLVGYYKDSPKEIHEHKVDCEYACCNICGTTVVCKKIQKGGVAKHTGAGLKSHLESAHKIYKDYSDELKSNIITIPECFEKQGVPKYSDKEEKQEHINDATVKWIVKECLPIDTTESISFQNMMKAAYYGYKNISSNQVEAGLNQLAMKVRRQIKKLVGKNIVSIASDQWTSLAKQNYEGITIHWIDNEWKRHSLPCGCFLHEDDSKSLSLSEFFFTNIFEGLGLDKLKITTIVTDTTSNMDKFGMIMRDDNSFDHIYCTDHVLQLSAKLAYMENEDDVQPLVKLRNLVKFFNKSSQATELLKKQQQHMTDVYDSRFPKVMLQDVVTRWWSMYTMVERAMELKSAIQSMELLGQIPPNYILTDVDWKYISSVYKVLKPFKSAQKMLDKEKNINASLVVGIIREMRKYLVNTSEDDELTNQLSKKILKDFEDRWGDANFPFFDGGDRRRIENRRQKGIHPKLVVATALDPRTKYLKGLSQVEVEQVWDVIFKALTRMHGEKEDDNSSDKGNVDDEPPSELQRQTQSVERDNNTQSDAVDEFYQGIMGSDDEDENDFRDGGGRIKEKIKQEIKCYRNEPKVPYKSGTTGKFTNVLEWWKYNERHYPMLASLARIVLCMPATSAPSERIFSLASLVISKKRGRTDPETAGNIIFLNETIDWYESVEDDE